MNKVNTYPLNMPPVPGRPKRSKIKSRIVTFILLAAALIVVSKINALFRSRNYEENSYSYQYEENQDYEYSTFLNSTEQVEQWRPKVEEAAARYGIPDQVDALMAILKAESGGRGKDIFQSSESAGLSPNTLDTDESIEQGVSYYAALLNEAALYQTDMNTVYQAYNYGKGYIPYVAEHGGIQTQELSEAFAKEYSKGKKVKYTNPVAVEANGGWRYAYGNMFYWMLIEDELNSSL